MSDRALFGFLNIDKPPGVTSHDVVAKVRRGLKTKKVGHAGTLDPMATGVLVVCVGAATRLSEYAMHATKQYRATVHLGVTTDTYDAEGEVQHENDAGGVTREDVERLLPDFLGEIQQRPPIYSAIKKGGRKLYEMARAGETVEVEARMVRIDALTLTDWQHPRFTLDVTCGAGTYIRSLAYDIGERLGVGAHLAALTRTAVGGFTLDDALTLDDLLAADDPRQHLIAPVEALPEVPVVALTDTDADDIAHGRFIDGAAGVDEGAVAWGVTVDGHLLAVLRAQDGRWRPHKVFPR